MINGLMRQDKCSYKELQRRISGNKYIYLLLLPGLAFYFIFNYMPMYGITLAFKDFMFNKGIGGSPWVGFQHFEDIFSDSKFWDVVINTLQIQLGRLVFEFPAPILIAILLNELPLKGFKRFVQSCMYFPYFISWIIIYSLLLNIFSLDTGVINIILHNLGFEKVNFLVSSWFFRPLVYTSNIWKMAGYSTILYLAAISNINPELYEAALVSGANRFQRMIHVTLPGIQVIALTIFILSIGNMMNGGFNQIFNLYNELVYDVGDIIDTYVYREGIGKALFGRTTAVGLFKSGINLILLLIVDNVSRRISGTGIY